MIEVINENSGNWPTYYSWIMHTTRTSRASAWPRSRDGTSNTLAISETVQGKGGDLRGFGWWGGGAHFETLLTPNSPLPDRTEQSCTPAVRLNPPCANREVGNPEGEETIAARSRHPVGVRPRRWPTGPCGSFSNNVNLDVWRAWGTAYAGDQTGGDENRSPGYPLRGSRAPTLCVGRREEIISRSEMPTVIPSPPAE